MNTLRTKLSLGLATLAIAAASLGFGGAPTDAIARKINEYEGQHFARKINEYEGQHFAKKGSFDITESEDQRNGRKINEYEGQHFARKVNEYEGQHFARIAPTPRLPLPLVNEYEGQHFARFASTPRDPVVIPRG